MQTARFDQIRRKSLDDIFKLRNIVKIWRDIVRSQLRSSDIKDMFDFFDLNYNIDQRAKSIRSSILNGSYKAGPSLVYRTEKKLGISRHMIIPQAIDALVLQVLADSIISDILANQPSKKAFYSQAKHSIMKPHELTEYGETMRKLWVRLQKTIYGFSKSKKFIVTTDLSNYYDSIDMDELKKVLSSYLKSNMEVVMDLLFGIIENISWRPDYLPYSNRGLPTSNLEAIRLLAHSFLFEVDDVLRKKTGNCFTRWMDDIVVGADSKKEAREIISATSDMLKSRGLALNQSKTDIYDKKDTYFHFQINENAYISTIEAKIKSGTFIKSRLISELKRKFDKHNIDNIKSRSWDKVAKRYITQFGRLESEVILSDVPRLYIEYASLRPNLLIYLLNLGYKKSTSQELINILNKIDIFDDTSLYQICDLVVKWEVLDDKDGNDFLKKVEDKLGKFVFNKPKREDSLDFYSLLWFKSKYSDPIKLLEFLIKYKPLWQSNSFMRRQATAIFSRLHIIDPKKVEGILSSQISSGDPNTVSIATQIEQFTCLQELNKILTPYLFTIKKQNPYPLPKFLVMCSVLNSEKIRTDKTITSRILSNISDPYYRKWLKDNYGIS